MNVSVIICTHNPRQDYLVRTLDALKTQTLSKDQWELLLIDNASNGPLAKSWDLSWHPHARHIREEELGLTHARIRGIREARGYLLVFVDDDNVLEPDYLDESLHLSEAWRMLGAWGAGKISAEYEESPHPLAQKWIEGLCIKELSRDSWCNIPEWSTACPFGAGLIVRKAVAQHYVNLTSKDTLRLSLDRVGRSMGAAGDTDMCFCACDIGLGMGRFRGLKLVHLIPRIRLKFDYLARLYGGFAYSHKLLQAIRSPEYSPPRRLSVTRLIESWLYYYSLLRADPLSRRIYRARRNGQCEAEAVLAKTLSQRPPAKQES